MGCPTKPGGSDAPFGAVGRPSTKSDAVSARGRRRRSAAAGGSLPRGMGVRLSRRQDETCRASSSLYSGRPCCPQSLLRTLYPSAGAGCPALAAVVLSVLRSNVQDGERGSFLGFLRCGSIDRESALASGVGRGGQLSLQVTTSGQRWSSACGSRAGEGGVKSLGLSLGDRVPKAIFSCGSFRGEGVCGCNGGIRGGIFQGEARTAQHSRGLAAIMRIPLSPEQTAPFGAVFLLLHDAGRFLKV